METYIPIAKIAQEIGLDRSNIRKYILSKGLTFHKIRTPESKGQQTLSLTEDDFNLLLRLRKEEGFNFDTASEGDNGYFYLIQPIPEYCENRIKIGFTNSIEKRLSTYKTICPSASVLKYYPCKRTWEKAAIDSVLRSEHFKIGGIEIFEFKSVDDALSKGDEFFATMPLL